MHDPRDVGITRRHCLRIGSAPGIAALAALGLRQQSVESFESFDQVDVHLR
jgi:hypothetical protein